jgi:S1-C subfamily serine protease
MGFLAYVQKDDPQWPNTAVVLWTGPGRPAHEAGLREGDRIIRVNGKRMFVGFHIDPSFGVPKADGKHTRFTLVRRQEDGTEKELEIEVVWGR